MQATALTEPRLHVLYRLDGGAGRTERELPLAGYRGSRPVRVGNAAVEQRQLDIYGALFETAGSTRRGDHRLDRDTGVVLGRIADHVVRHLAAARLRHLGGARTARSISRTRR